MADRNYVFVSDLHLSEGFLTDERRYHVNEDFFYDDAFARFLDYLENKRKAARYQKPWRLVVNGDFLDFLQVTTAPGEDALKAFLESAMGAAHDDAVVKISKKERRLGLGFDAAKSVWKLARIMEGHPRFFAALAGFLAAGNDLVIIKGNHDAEFTYPEVRNYFRKAIDGFAKGARRDLRGLSGERPAGKGRAKVGPVSKRVLFSRWFCWEEGLFYAEHGGQYDDSNRYVFFLDPTMYLPGKKAPTIRFPFGSFFVRYFFNKLEGRVPFADNIRPRVKAFWWVIAKKTWYAVLECGTFISFIANFVRKKVFSHFDQLAFLEWLRLKKNVFARGLYYVFFFPVIKFVVRPDPRQYARYKSRNFWLMFEAEYTNGIIPEKGADTGKTGPSAAALLKIYNRSFRTGTFTPEKETKLAELLRAVMPTETREIAAAKGMSNTEIINDFVAELSAARRRRHVVLIRLFQSWRFAATFLSLALVLWSLAHWAFRVPWFGISVPIVAAVVYLLRGLGEEVLLKYYDVAPERYLHKAAVGVGRILGVPYVIFGHTHVAYIRPVELETGENHTAATRWEVNTGSWTPVYDEKMMLRRTGDEFPFVQITTEGEGEAELQLLHWNDALGEPQTIRYTGGC